jgi:beta-phosphoglucomutase-like phosphatase (HAD superfamily)
MFDTTAPVSLSSVAIHWRACLDAEESALAAAARCGRSVGFPSGELGVRTGRLAEERREVATLLDALARQEHVTISHPLSAPRATARMLGLPVGTRACVFDLDGVLTASADVHAAAWRETLDTFLRHRVDRADQRFAVPYFDLRRDYDALIHGKPRLEGIHAFLASRGITLPEGEPGDVPGSETVHGLANRKNELFKRRLARHPLVVLRGSNRYLEAAAEARLGRAVVSPSSNARGILERSGLTHLVQECIDGRVMTQEGMARKPAPDTLTGACRRLGVPPAQVAAFETLPAGVEAARNAGVGFVVGIDRHGGEELRRRGADLVVADLAELLDPALGD